MALSNAPAAAPVNNMFTDMHMHKQELKTFGVWLLKVAVVWAVLLLFVFHRGYNISASILLTVVTLACTQWLLAVMQKHWPDDWEPHMFMERCVDTTMNILKVWAGFVIMSLAIRGLELVRV